MKQDEYLIIAHSREIVWTGLKFLDVYTKLFSRYFRKSGRSEWTVWKWNSSLSAYLDALDAHWTLSRLPSATQPTASAYNNAPLLCAPHLHIRNFARSSSSPQSTLAVVRQPFVPRSMLSRDVEQSRIYIYARIVQWENKRAQQ